MVVKVKSQFVLIAEFRANYSLKYLFCKERGRNGIGFNCLFHIDKKRGYI